MIDREELERLHEADPVSLNECPPGLFMFGQCLGFKSEYVTTLENPRRYQVDAYVVASGEYFHGGARGTEQRGNLVVQPLDCETIATLLTERDTLAAENARLEEANRTIAAECIKWAREAGEAKGKLEGSEAAGVVDQWREKCEQLEAENAALTAKVERLEGALVKIQDEGDVRANSIATGALKEAP